MDLRTLDHWAPHIKECELRLLIKLRALTKGQENDFIQISTTELAALVKQKQSAVRRSLKRLTERGLIGTRQATATQKTKIWVNAFKPVSIAQCQPSNPSEGVPLDGAQQAASAMNDAEAMDLAIEGEVMGTHQRYYLTVTVPLPRPATEITADAVETAEFITDTEP